MFVVASSSTSTRAPGLCERCRWPALFEPYEGTWSKLRIQRWRSVRSAGPRASSRSSDVSLQLRRVGQKERPVSLPVSRWAALRVVGLDGPDAAKSLLALGRCSLTSPGRKSGHAPGVPGARELCAPLGTRVYTNLVACLRHRRRTLRARPGGMATGLRCATGKGRPMWPASKWERRTWTCLNFDAPHVGCA